MWKALVRPLYLSHLLMSYWPDQARAKLTVTAGRDLNSTSLKKKKKCHIDLPTLNPIPSPHPWGQILRVYTQLREEKG